MDADLPVIRASEINEYAFCARAWWLARARGLEPDNTVELAQGMASHKRHGVVLFITIWLRRVAIALIVMALLLAISLLMHR